MSEEALKENKMGVMPMPKLMLSMGLPMIISMIVQAFYNIVDSYFVSRITDDTVEHIGEYAVNARKALWWGDGAKPHILKMLSFFDS